MTSFLNMTYKYFQCSLSQHYQCQIIKSNYKISEVHDKLFMSIVEIWLLSFLLTTRTTYTKNVLIVWLISTSSKSISSKRLCILSFVEFSQICLNFVFHKIHIGSETLINFVENKTKPVSKTYIQFHFFKFPDYFKDIERTLRNMFLSCII